MKQTFILSGIVIVSVLFGLSMKPIDFNFPSAWKKVKNLERKGLYESALKEVDLIFEAAKKYEVTDQIIKSTIYKSKLTLSFKDVAEVHKIYDIEKALNATTQNEVKALFHVLLADLYHQYINNNLYRINNRTFVPNENSEKIEEWSVKSLRQKSHSHMDMATSFNGLNRVSLDHYNLLFEGEESNSLSLKNKNLQAFIYVKAIRFYQNSSNNVGLHNGSQFLRDHHVFLDENSFLDLDYSDPKNNKEKAHAYFQKLIKLLGKSKDKKAKIKAAFWKLTFESNYCTRSDKESQYLEYCDKAMLEGDSYQLAVAKYHKAQKLIALSNGSESIKGYDLNRLNINAMSLISELNDKKVDEEIRKAAATLRDQLELTELSIQVEKMTLPNENGLVKVNFKNQNQFQFEILALDDASINVHLNMNEEELLKWLKKRPVTESWSETSDWEEDYRQHAVEAIVPAMKRGHYLIVVTEKGLNKTSKSDHYAFCDFIVSELGFSTFATPDETQILVYNRNSGLPIKGAKVHFYTKDYNRILRVSQKNLFNTLITNERGVVKTTDSGKQMYVSIEYKDEKLNPDFSIYLRKNQPNKARSEGHLLTDRSLYRLGQRVYFSGISFDRSGKGNLRVKANEKVDIEVFDANYQSIHSLSLMSDEFGVVHGDFVLPKDKLTGNFSIRMKGSGFNTQSNIKVENYKRPQFNVETDSLKANYSLGDEVQIYGTVRTYTDFPIQDATVKFTVTRSTYRPYYPWRRGGYYYPQQQANQVIAFDQVKSNKEGIFVCSFQTKQPEQNIDFSKSYIVLIEVLDSNGETISHTKSFVLNKKPFRIKHDFKTTYFENTISNVTFQSINVEDKEIKSDKRVEIEKLHSPTTFQRVRLWNDVDKRFYSESTFEKSKLNYHYDDKLGYQDQWPTDPTFSKIVVPIIESNRDIDLKNGTYKLTMMATDEDGNVDSLAHFITVYNESLVGNELIVHEESEKIFRVGTTYKIPYLVNEEVSSVLVQKWQNRHLLNQYWLNGQNEASIEGRISEENQGGISYRLIAFYKNRKQEKIIRLDVPWEASLLDFEALSFNSSIKPNEEVSWSFNLRSDNPIKKAFNVTACLFDASLEALHPHQWKRSFYRTNNQEAPIQYFGYNVGRSRVNYVHSQRSYHVFATDTYPHTSWFGYIYMHHNNGWQHRGGKRMKSMSRNAENRVMMESDMAAPAAMDVSEESIQLSKSEINEPSEQPIIPIRKDLSETVFFYPNLQTSSDGQFDIDFKMNEGVSTYKLLLFAHNEDMRYAFEERTIVSKKDVLIRPNFPRVITSGDQLLIPVKVENNTNESIEGKVNLNVIPLMKQTLSKVQINENNQRIKIPAISSKTVYIEIVVPEDFVSPLDLVVTFEGNGFQDGESKTVNVIPIQTLVRNANGYWVNPGETVPLNLTDFGLDYAMNIDAATFEIASNPIFLLLQSVPSLHESPDKYLSKVLDNINLLSLMNHITSKNPQLLASALLDAVGAEKTPLTRNESLKSIPLDGTPWVQDAIYEENRKFNLAKYQNANQIKNEISDHHTLLKSFQNQDGGFSWIREGRSSFQMSMIVLEKLGRLRQLGAWTLNDATFDIQNAIQYIDEQAQKYFKNLGSKDQLSGTMLQYLYVKAMFTDFNDFTPKKAVGHYKKMIQKYWVDMDIHYQILIGLWAQLDGNVTVANEVLASLKERAISKEDQGIYWKEINGYYDYYNNILSQSYALEFFEKMDEDDKWINGIKQWLIANKRVSIWNQRSNAAEVLYAFLNNGSDWVKTSTDIEVKIDAKLLKIEEQKNYQTFNLLELESLGETIFVKNNNEFPIYGFFQSQHFENKNEVIGSSNGPLKVSKQYFVEDRSGAEIQWNPVKENLNVGDKLKVKVKIESDRRLSFVTLKDARGSGFEPVDLLSGFGFNDGLYFYRSILDQGQHFYFDALPKGSFVFEYEVRVVHEGNYSQGFAEIQSYYAPEFGSYSDGRNVFVHSDEKKEE